MLEPEKPSAAEVAAGEATGAVALDDMTKVELLQYAHDAGIKVPQYGKKEELLAAIRAAGEDNANIS